MARTERRDSTRGCSRVEDTCRVSNRGSGGDNASLVMMAPGVKWQLAVRPAASSASSLGVCLHLRSTSSRCQVHNAVSAHSQRAVVHAHHMHRLSGLQSRGTACRAAFANCDQLYPCPACYNSVSWRLDRGLPHERITQAHLSWQVHQTLARPPLSKPSGALHALPQNALLQHHNSCSPAWEPSQSWALPPGSRWYDGSRHPTYDPIYRPPGRALLRGQSYGHIYCRQSLSPSRW